MSIFTPKISDDRFLVIDHVFQIFPYPFSRFSISLLCQMSYMTLSSPEKPVFQEINSLITPFLTLFVLSRASHNTTSQNIGGMDAWAIPSPPQILGGPSPSPLGLRPCLLIILYTVRLSINIFDSYQLWYSP